MIDVDTSPGGERFESSVTLSPHSQAPARMVHEVILPLSFEVSGAKLACDMHCEEELGKVISGVLDSAKLKACKDDPEIAYPHTVAGVRMATARLAESGSIAVQMRGEYPYAFALRRRTLKSGDVWEELVARPIQAVGRPAAVVAVWDFEGFMHHSHGKRSNTSGNRADYKKYLTTVVEVVRAFVK